MIPQADIDNLMEHARQRAAALKVERHTLDQAAASYELRAQFAPLTPTEQPDDDGHPEAIIVWAGIAACFFLGVPLVFVCLPWAALAPTFASVAGALLGVALLVLGVAAAGKMVERRR